MSLSIYLTSAQRAKGSSEPAAVSMSLLKAARVLNPDSAQPVSCVWEFHFYFCYQDSDLSGTEIIENSRIRELWNFCGIRLITFGY